MFWLISLVLILSALFLNLGALGEAQRHVDRIHRAMNSPEPQRQTLEAEAKQFSQKSDVLVISGWVVAAVSLIFLFLSYRKEESAPHSVVVVLLAFYLLLQFGAI